MVVKNRIFCVDTHCHLDYLAENYKPADVVAHARQNGVRKMITVGTQWGNCDTLVGYHDEFADVFCALGIHPESAKDWVNRIQEIDFENFVHSPQVVALGETGLDYLRCESSREAQIALFELHIQACKQYDLPIIIHCRSATQDMLQILRKHYKPDSAKGVIHCFHETLKTAQAFMDLGFFLSISGMVTFKTSKWREFHDVVTQLPKDRILIETDAPYLTPEPNRGDTNEPAYVPLVLKRIALLQDCDEEGLARQIYKNTHLAFSKLGKDDYDNCE